MMMAGRVRHPQCDQQRTADDSTRKGCLKPERRLPDTESERFLDTELMLIYKHLSPNFEVKAKMEAFRLTSPAQIIERVAARMKRRRIDANLTQRELASRSGVSFSTLRMFEEKGKASFEAVVKLAFALEAEAEFEALFPARPPLTLDDVIGRPERQRVRKK